MMGSRVSSPSRPVSPRQSSPLEVHPLCQFLYRCHGYSAEPALEKLTEASNRLVRRVDHRLRAWTAGGSPPSGRHSSPSTRYPLKLFHNKPSARLVLEVPVMV